MFDTAPGVEHDEPVDPQLEDAFDWARIERELRTGEEDRTWGNTVPSGLSPWRSTRTPVSRPVCRMRS
jgi:hypothetical protein